MAGSEAVRRLLLAGAAALSLAGCGTTGGVGLTPAVISNAIAATCGVVVDLATLANLAAAGNSTFTSLETIATSVCAAVQQVGTAPVPKSVRRRMARSITVNIGGITVPVRVAGT